MFFLSSFMGFRIVIVLPMLLFFIYQVYHLIVVGMNLKRAMAEEDRLAAAAAIEAAMKAEPRESYDVVVIGAGSAGFNAAIAARRAGASVLLLEKHSFSGGNSMLAAGGYNAVGTKQQ